MEKTSLIENIKKLSITDGDTVLVRAALSSVGKLPDGPNELIDAFLEVIGINGTLVSLAFTSSYFLKKE